MPDVGSSYNLLTGTSNYPAVDMTVIDPDDHNAELEDIATAMTARLQRNGAGSMSGNLNMGSNKITSLAAATTNGDAVRYEQAQLVNAFATAWEGAAWGAGKMGYATGATAVSLIDTTAIGRAFLNYADPNADRIVFFDDSEGAFGNLSLGTGLSISTTTLSLEAGLAAISALSKTDGNIIVGDGATWVAESGATARASLGAASSALTLTAGLGLSGGGDLSSNRSFALDFSELSDTAIATGDGITFMDASDSNNPKRRTASSFISDLGLALLAGATFTGEVILANVGPTNILAAGWRGVPFTEVSADRTFVLTDVGKGFYHNSGSNHTLTVPPMSSVAWPQGSCFALYNYPAGGNYVVAPGSGVSLLLGGANSTASASRTVTPGGFVVVQHFVGDAWVVSGSNVS